MKIKRAIEILKKANHENDNFWWTDGEKQLSGDDIDNAIKSLLCTGYVQNGENNSDVDYTIIIGTDY